MNILYVAKEERGSFLKRNLKELRDRFFLHHRVGFFLASLMTISNVRMVSYQKLTRLSKAQIKKYDAILFNYECRFRSFGHPFDTLFEGLKQSIHRIDSLPKILLISSPSAKTMPEDKVLDYFQLVFKREPFSDLGKYDISQRNREKIHPTILSCPLVPSTILNYKKIDAKDYGYKFPSPDYDHDVFFLGQATSSSRKKIIKHIQESADFDFFGGLHVNVRDPDMSFPNQLKMPRFTKKQFYQSTRKSKINLALEGYGAFTYRHWELWGLSAFMLSSKSILDLQLPFTFNEGEHLVVFDNEKDLVEKIIHYLNSPEERIEISKNGRKLFEEEYNFHKHGDFIKNKIDIVL